jgi:hypothetical protein
MKLCDVMMKYGSDKGGDQYTNHNYTVIYDPLLSILKTKPDVNFFELGIGSVNPNVKSNMSWLKGYKSGASQRAWAEWLPKANIFCADIDRDALFTEPRIKSFWVDQTSSESIADMWKQIPEQFDVIIDDGLHTPFAGHTFMMCSMHKLKPEGLYIIEDIPDADYGFFHTRLPDYEMHFQSVELVRLHHGRNEGDNNLLLCRK